MKKIIEWYISNYSKWWFASSILLIVEMIILIVFICLGFGIAYPDTWENNWTAIGAIGQCVSALVAFAIPIAVIFIQEKINKNKADISGSNLALLKEMESIKKQIADLENANAKNKQIYEQSKNSDDIKYQDLKRTALKIVNIGMFVNTQYVADQLEIDKTNAFNILKELVLHDRAITCGGALIDSNIDKIIWLRK